MLYAALLNIHVVILMIQHGFNAENPKQQYEFPAEYTYYANKLLSLIISCYTKLSPHTNTWRQQQQQQQTIRIRLIYHCE